LPKDSNENILYQYKGSFNMAFTDKQIFAALEKNEYVRDCFSKIADACKELKSNTGCPDDDVDRFLEFTMGKWR